MLFFVTPLTFQPIFGKRALNLRQAFSETVENGLLLNLVGGVPQGTDPLIFSIWPNLLYSVVAQQFLLLKLLEIADDTSMHPSRF